MPKSDPKFLKEIRQLRCLGCGAWPPNEVHHVTTKRWVGDEHFNCLPLCPHCHRSDKGWHGGKWSFLKAHPHIVEHLKKLGWEIDLKQKIMFHAEGGVQKTSKKPI